MDFLTRAQLTRSHLAPLQTTSQRVTWGDFSLNDDCYGFDGHFACDFEEIFFLLNEKKTNFQRKQLSDSAAVAEYASKPHVVVKLQSQVFSSFHLRSMIFVMIMEGITVKQVTFTQNSPTKWLQPNRANITERELLPPRSSTWRPQPLPPQRQRHRARAGLAVPHHPLRPPLPGSHTRLWLGSGRFCHHHRSVQ